jgi:cholesterol transport system auxiliary component
VIRTVSTIALMGLRRAGRLALPLMAAVALAGCTTLISGPPSNIFDLTAPGDVKAPRGGLQVLVPQPTTVRALDTDRIAARPSPTEYAYLPNAVWSDNLPKLLQARLVETLQNSGRVRAAATPGQGLLIDYQLLVDVRAFEITSEGAVADFAVRLMNDRNGRVLKSRVFRYGVQIAARDNANMVAALDKAMDLAFADIVKWALS